MPRCRLRVAWRENRGLVRARLLDETIEATCLREAVGAVLSHAESLLVDGTNLAWLTDAEGNLLWTLRMDERNADAT